MGQDKSRSLWELLSDVFREAAVLLWVFGVLLDHEHVGIEPGIVVGLGGMVLFIMSLVFEYIIGLSIGLLLLIPLGYIYTYSINRRQKNSGDKVSPRSKAHS